MSVSLRKTPDALPARRPDLNYVVPMLLDLYDGGAMTAEQTLNALAIDAGRIERTEESKAIGTLIDQVQDGILPAAVLVAAAEATR